MQEANGRSPAKGMGKVPLADYVHEPADADDTSIVVLSDLSDSELDELAEEIIALLRMEIRLERERMGRA